MMPKNEDVHPQDLLNAKKSSAADEYYRFMLRKAKLESVNETSSGLTADELKALSETSTREKVELKTLARLYMLDDHSPEFLQVKAITGSHNREEIASKLTDRYMEKIQVENVLDRFIAPTTNKARITEAMTASRTFYDAFGNSR
jgi:hypothetical protein